VDEARRAVEEMLRSVPQLVIIEHEGDEMECSLARPEGLDDAQLGYSATPDGASLVGGDGGWRREWLAIGYETLCGDPIFVDLSDEQLPVFTAPHGEGVWTPTRVEASLAAFLARATPAG
jgi:hypothetical protein